MVRARPGASKKDEGKGSAQRGAKSGVDTQVLDPVCTRNFCLGASLVGIVGFCVPFFWFRSLAHDVRADKERIQVENRNDEEDMGKLVLELQTAKKLADPQDAADEHLMNYLQLLERMNKLMVSKNAPDDARLFVNNEASKLYLNRLPWNTVIEKHAASAAEAIRSSLKDRQLYPNCCNTTACVSGNVKLLLLLKDLGRRNTGKEVLKELTAEQRNSGALSCRGVQWEAGLDRLVSPLTDDFPAEYTNIVVPSQHDKPFWESSEVPMAQFLEDHSAELLKEADTVLGGGTLPGGFGHDHLNVDLASNTASWSTLNLFNEGVWNEENCKVLPTTCALLQTRPELKKRLKSARSTDQLQLTFATVYRLRAPAKIHRHLGNQWRLNVHFGLKTPSAATIRVWGEERSWQRGKCVTFADASEHAVDFPGSGEDRLVLNVVVWHPKVLKHQEENPTFATQFE